MGCFVAHRNLDPIPVAGILAGCCWPNWPADQSARPWQAC
ncbi:hypothetical protein COLO4_15671 [Corchorus olitorius]|uniref:Uncharacterized protein n=1 Tax=Corchorus olitorius TaxID=93759 RepID=A0A1R3JLV9_9ROSI|nr:hypothetical protein COLO4_15671 [Corchorus olitorius]